MNFDEMVNKLNDPALKQKLRDLANTQKGKDAVNKLNNLDQKTIDSYIKNINSNNIPPQVLEQLSKLLK